MARSPAHTSRNCRNRSRSSPCAQAVGSIIRARVDGPCHELARSRASRRRFSRRRFSIGPAGISTGPRWRRTLVEATGLIIFYTIAIMAAVS